jgi:hypothetical protein
MRSSRRQTQSKSSRSISELFRHCPRPRRCSDLTPKLLPNRVRAEADSASTTCRSCIPPAQRAAYKKSAGRYPGHPDIPETDSKSHCTPATGKEARAPIRRALIAPISPWHVSYHACCSTRHPQASFILSVLSKVYFSVLLDLPNTTPKSERPVQDRASASDHPDV